MINIDLSNYGETFGDKELVGLKEINFFYGKNGTGKTTLCNAISDQFGQEYDVRIFQGFESVIDEDEKLNSIVLGEDNKKVQMKIDSKLEIIDRKKTQLTNELELLKSLNGDVDVEEERHTYLIQYKKSEDRCTRKKDEIIQFYKKYATELTNQFNLARSYNRNNFKKDIPFARILTDEDYKKYLIISKTDEKKRIAEQQYPTTNFEAYLKSVNEIISSKVEAVVIKELQEDSSKRAFVEAGLEIHEVGDKCVFCEGEVTAERIIKLKSFFNTEEVVRLQDRIKKGISRIEECLEDLKKIESLDQMKFYSHISIEELNVKLAAIKNEQILFLEECKNQLEKKEKELFVSMEHCDMKIPSSFISIQTDINKQVRNHNEFSNNIEINKNEANLKLRLHCVAEKCEQMGHERLQGELETLKNTRKESKRILVDKIEKVESSKNNLELEIRGIQSEIRELQNEIKNPEVIITKINEKLSKSGKQNLKLKYIESGKHYKVLNKDDTTRNVKEISTGEKNIIAFLYFIGSLDSPELDIGKPKLIILDDPMSSNDDTMQYLIISEIEKLYNRKNFFSHFILLTHNSHFYLKASHGRRIRRDGKNPYEIDQFIRMINDGNLTSFKYLTSQKEDFTTQYGSLWKELKFLYENDKKDFMCNTIRRIIETYTIFNQIEGNKDSESKMLFNTNSHYTEVGDLETDTNGYTREKIIELLKNFFKEKNAERHFNNYWSRY